MSLVSHRLFIAVLMEILQFDIYHFGSNHHEKILSCMQKNRFRHKLIYNVMLIPGNISPKFMFISFRITYSSSLFYLYILATAHL